MQRSFLRTSIPMAFGLVLVGVCAMAQEPAAVDVVKAPATGAVPLLSRWLHILSAIFMLGTAFYVRGVLMPAAKATLDDETHQKLRAAVTRQWGKYLHVLILILIVTGLYNFLKVTAPAHPDNPSYHMLFGIKFLLAIVVFGLASMLAGKKSISRKLQQNSGLWLGVTIAMGVAIVMIAGYMKQM